MEAVKSRGPRATGRASWQRERVHLRPVPYGLCPWYRRVVYSGERVTSEPMLTVTMEQGAAAYRFVSELARGKTVLDVACGEGYGPYILAQSARAVLAVDRDKQTVTNAKNRYRVEHLSFLCSDIFVIPKKLHGQTFDVVCSFQFLEHLEGQRAFLQLLRSFVRPGGIIAVSTPNRRVFPTFNPYHVREVDAAELRALFTEEFPTTRVFGIFGDAHVLQYRTSKQKLGDLLLRLDVLQARQWLPRPVIRKLYDLISYFLLKRMSFLKHRSLVTSVTQKNFSVREDDLERALDLIAVAQTSPVAPEMLRMPAPDNVVASR